MSELETVYHELQSELKITQRTIEYSKKLHEDLVKKALFKYESPYLIASISIYAVTCMEGEPKPLNEISLVSHIKESALRECYQRVYDDIEDSLKNL